MKCSRCDKEINNEVYFTIRRIAIEKPILKDGHLVYEIINEIVCPKCENDAFEEANKDD